MPSHISGEPFSHFAKSVRFCVTGCEKSYSFVRELSVYHFAIYPSFLGRTSLFRGRAPLTLKVPEVPFTLPIKPPTLTVPVEDDETDSPSSLQSAIEAASPACHQKVAN